MAEVAAVAVQVLPQAVLMAVMVLPAAYPVHPFITLVAAPDPEQWLEMAETVVVQMALQLVMALQGPQIPEVAAAVVQLIMLVHPPGLGNLQMGVQVVQEL